MGRGWYETVGAAPRQRFCVGLGGQQLALRSNGALAGWGSNSTGQINVPSGNDFVAAAAGRKFGIALRIDGSIVGWLSNGGGELIIPAR